MSPGAGTPAGSPALPPPFTLAAAVGHAIGHNPDVLAATLKLEETRARKGEARAGLFPQVRLGASGGVTNNFATLLSPSTTGAADDQNLTALLGQTSNLFASTRLSIGQTLLDWGRLGTGIEVADLDEIVAFEELRAARQAVALQVRTAYIGLAGAREASVLATRAAERARDHLETARKRQARGTETELTVLQAEAKALGLEQDARRAAREARKAESALDLLLGMGPEHAIVLAGHGAEPSSPVPPLAEARDRAMEARADVRISAAQGRQERAKLDFEARATWPTVGLSVSGGVTRSSLVPRPLPDVSALGTVSWSLFDGFRSQGALRRAELALHKQQHARERLLDRVAAEVEAEREAVIEAGERLALAEREREVARKALAAAESRLQNRVATTLDVLDADLAVLRAEHHASQALHESMLARARLAGAMGEDPPERPLAGAPVGWKAP